MRAAMFRAQDHPYRYGLFLRGHRGEGQSRAERQAGGGGGEQPERGADDRELRGAEVWLSLGDACFHGVGEMPGAVDRADEVRCIQTGQPEDP